MMYKATLKTQSLKVVADTSYISKLLYPFYVASLNLLKWRHICGAWAIFDASDNFANSILCNGSWKERSWGTFFQLLNTMLFSKPFFTPRVSFSLRETINFYETIDAFFEMNFFYLEQISVCYHFDGSSLIEKELEKKQKIKKNSILLRFNHNKYIYIYKVLKKVFVFH